MKEKRETNMFMEELRSYYNAFFRSVLMAYVMTMLLTAGLSILSEQYLLKYTNSSVISEIITVACNCIPVLLAPLLVFMIALRKFPDGKNKACSPLSAGEFFLAVTCSFGFAHLFSIATDLFMQFVSNMWFGGTTNDVETVSAEVPFWLNFLSLAVFYPVAEEIVFRRVLLDRLKGLGEISAVILSALAFSVFHTNLNQLLYTFVLGVIFGAIAVHTGRITETVILHIMINSCNVFLSHLDNEVVWSIFSGLQIVGAIYSVIALAARGKQISFDSGEIPLNAGEKVKMCMKSVWFWVTMAIFLLLGATVTF